MNKTIKSGLRELWFCIVTKFKDKQQEEEAAFSQKQDCLRVIGDFLLNLENVSGTDEILKTIDTFTDLEQKNRISTQNQYLEQIASLTSKLIKESFDTVTPEEWKKMSDHVKHIENKYKERDHITEENLESFIINVADSNNSDSDESFNTEVLESDFDYSE